MNEVPLCSRAVGRRVAVLLLVALEDQLRMPLHLALLRNTWILVYILCLSESQLPPKIVDLLNITTNYSNKLTVLWGIRLSESNYRALGRAVAVLLLVALEDELRALI